MKAVRIEKVKKPLRYDAIELKWHGIGKGIGNHINQFSPCQNLYVCEILYIIESIL